MSNGLRDDDRGGECPICRLAFLSQQALVQHLIDVHDRDALLGAIDDRRPPGASRRLP
jgi:hypothetical protein